MVFFHTESVYYFMEEDKLAISFVNWGGRKRKGTLITDNFGRFSVLVEP